METLTFDLGKKSKTSDHWHRPALLRHLFSFLSSIFNLHLSLTQTMWRMLQDHSQASVLIKKHFRHQVHWKILSAKSLKERRTFQPDIIMSRFIVFIKSCLNLKHRAYPWWGTKKMRLSSDKWSHFSHCLLLLFFYMSLLMTSCPLLSLCHSPWHFCLNSSCTNRSLWSVHSQAFCFGKLIHL